MPPLFIVFISCLTAHYAISEEKYPQFNKRYPWFSDLTAILAVIFYWLFLIEAALTVGRLH